MSFVESWSFATTILFAFVIGFMCYQSIRTKEWLNKHEPIGFHTFNRVIDDRLWQGDKLQLIHSKSFEDENNYNRRSYSRSILFREYLCKSTSENYVILKVCLNGLTKKIDIENYLVCNEARAKIWLGSEIEKYEEFFGKTELA